MSRNHYPEHLNPFAEPKNKTTFKINNSFREFTKSLRKSFRIKRKTKKDDVEIRQKPPDYQRLCPRNRETYPTLAFPRSRFEERLSKPPSTLSSKFEAIPSPNPFEEEEAVRTIRRKNKKRAPLPPSKAISSQNINENLNIASHNQSKWSLNSVDTEYSYSTDNISGSECDLSINDTLAEKIANFTKEIEKLNDDSNNNNISSESKNEENTVPDLVVSCPNDELKDNLNDQKKTEKLETSNESEPKLCKIEEKSENLEEIKMKTEELENEPFKTDEDIPDIDDDVLYNEKKSIYINGSRDELNNEIHSERYSLFLAGSNEEIDKANNNLEEITKNVDEEEIKEEITPTPKQRKNKLTKNTLLGTTDV